MRGGEYKVHNVLGMYSVMITAKIVVWYIRKKNQNVIFFFPFSCIYKRRWMLAEPVVTIIFQYTYIKPLCCVS